MKKISEDKDFGTKEVGDKTKYKSPTESPVFLNDKTNKADLENCVSMYVSEDNKIFLNDFLNQKNQEDKRLYKDAYDKFILGKEINIIEKRYVFEIEQFISLTFVNQSLKENDVNINILEEEKNEDSLYEKIIQIDQLDKEKKEQIIKSILGKYTDSDFVKDGFKNFLENENTFFIRELIKNPTLIRSVFNTFYFLEKKEFKKSGECFVNGIVYSNNEKYFEEAYFFVDLFYSFKKIDISYIDKTDLKHDSLIASLFVGINDKLDEIQDREDKDNLIKIYERLFSTSPNITNCLSIPDRIDVVSELLSKDHSFDMIRYFLGELAFDAGSFGSCDYIREILLEKNDLEKINYFSALTLIFKTIINEQSHSIFEEDTVLKILDENSKNKDNNTLLKKVAKKSVDELLFYLYISEEEDFLGQDTLDKMFNQRNTIKGEAMASRMNCFKDLLETKTKPHYVLQLSNKDNYIGLYNYDRLVGVLSKTDTKKETHQEKKETEDKTILKKTPLIMTVEEFVKINNFEKLSDRELRDLVWGVSSFYDPHIRMSVEEDIGVSFKDLNMPTQIALVKFLINDKSDRYDDLINKIKKQKTKNKKSFLNSFLSVADNIADGDKILSLTEDLPEDIASSLFKNYSEHISTMYDITGKVNKYFYETVNEVVIEYRNLVTRLIKEGKEQILNFDTNGTKEEVKNRLVDLIRTQDQDNTYLLAVVDDLLEMNKELVSLNEKNSTDKQVKECEKKIINKIKTIVNESDTDVRLQYAIKKKCDDVKVYAKNLSEEIASLYLGNSELNQEKIYKDIISGVAEFATQDISSLTKDDLNKKWIDIEKTETEIMFFGNVFKSIVKQFRGKTLDKKIDLSEFKDMKDAWYSIGDLSEDKKQEMINIYSDNWAHNPVMQEEIISNFKKKLQSNDDKYKIYLLDYKNKVTSFVLFEDRGDVYHGGSFNVVDKLKKYGIGDVVLRNSFLDILKEKPVVAEAEGQKFTTPYYVEKFGFTIESINDHYSKKDKEYLLFDIVTEDIGGSLNSLYRLQPDSIIKRHHEHPEEIFGSETEIQLINIGVKGDDFNFLWNFVNEKLSNKHITRMIPADTQSTYYVVFEPKLKKVS